MIITPTGSVDKRTFTGSPTQSVFLSKVALHVKKQFAAATSDSLTVASPVGCTVVTLLNAHANMYPGSMSVVEDGDKYAVKFQATIFFTAELNDGNIILLSNTIQVLGTLGLIADTPVSPKIPAVLPVISCSDTGITAGGGSVYGKITIGAFDVEVVQLSDLNVVVDPDL